MTGKVETVSPSPPTPAPADARWLRGSVAFVWLATGLLVLHPAYRRIGAEYLGRLGLPEWVMVVTCAGEVLLGLRVALGPASTWVTALQIGLISGFSAVLIYLSPLLLADPFGVLTKNVPLLAVIATAWLLEREGWSPRACWLLRAGMASIWILEGLLPKVLFPQPGMLQVVAEFGILPSDPRPAVYLIGLCEITSGVAALLLRGRVLRLLLLGQATAIAVFPAIVSVYHPEEWLNPFGPMTKNVPIAVGTWLAAWRALR